MAPEGGFLATNVFWPELQRRFTTWNTVALRGGKKVKSDAATEEFIFSMGVRSSKIQMERPWVPRTRSFSRDWSSMSSTGTVGKLFLNAVQLAPRSEEIHRPNSVPAKRRLVLRACSRRTWTVPAESGMPLRMGFQVSP